MSRVGFDSNVLLYAEGIDDASRQAMALSLTEHLNPTTVVIPGQALGEVFHVLVRRGWRRAEARRIILRWANSYSVADTTSETLREAANLAADHGYSIWDSVIICVAAAADCRLLLSEDMQHGFSWNGVTIVNPFAEPMHPRLASLLAL